MRWLLGEVFLVEVRVAHARGGLASSSGMRSLLTLQAPRHLRDLPLVLHVGHVIFVKVFLVHNRTLVK